MAACRHGIHGAVLTLLGIVASGPLAILLVSVTHPQPPWGGPELFARSYHPIQALPFLAGFLLVGGCVVLLASLHAMARPEQRARSGSALSFAAAFAALVFFNYVTQMTFIPGLARHYTAQNGVAISIFSMANPTSVGWAIEMWAYGLLGVATWLVAPVLDGSRVGRVTAQLFVANGIISVVGAIATAAKPGWVMTTLGFATFALWNVVVVVMALLTVIVLRRRLILERGRRVT